MAAFSFIPTPVASLLIVFYLQKNYTLFALKIQVLV